MGINDGVLVYYSLAEVQLRGTDRLHCVNECEEFDCNRNLTSRNAGRMILMDIEYELGAMDQAWLTTDGIHFDNIEGQAWLNKSLPRAIG